MSSSLSDFPRLWIVTRLLVELLMVSPSTFGESMILASEWAGLEVTRDREVLRAPFSENSLSMLIAANLLGLVGDCQLLSSFSLFLCLSLEAAFLNL